MMHAAVRAENQNQNYKTVTSLFRGQCGKLQEHRGKYPSQTWAKWRQGIREGFLGEVVLYWVLKKKQELGKWRREWWHFQLEKQHMRSSKHEKLYVSAAPAIQSAVWWSWREQGSRSRTSSVSSAKGSEDHAKGLGFHSWQCWESPKTVRAGKALNFH